MINNSISNPVVVNELVAILRDISNNLDSDKLSAADLVQICTAVISFLAVIAAVVIPFLVIKHEEKQRSIDKCEQKEEEKEDIINREKEILIALHCLLVGNLNSLLSYKRQFLHSAAGEENPVNLKGDVQWINNELKAVTEPNKTNQPDYQKWLHDIANNKSLENICNGHLYPNLTDLFILLDKINFISKKIPNTFVLIHTINALNLQYAKVSDLRNAKIDEARSIVGHDINRAVRIWFVINEHTAALCDAVDDCIAHTKDAMDKLSVFLKKAYNHEQEYKVSSRHSGLIPDTKPLYEDSYLT